MFSKALFAVFLLLLTVLSIGHSQLLSDCVPTGEVCVVDVALTGGCCTGFCAVPPGQTVGVCDVLVPVAIAAAATV
ncbi:Antimicrobial peptide 1 [Orchesella cincta]|uniref:Antimicrobial peptide 1 n=1 Tax=Orchesella cincta TaxID=48709 RepID=A0A1D2N685_ORCCI|nr:Antimicrobial peptide 1 [Orchesella cincta]